MAHNINEDRVMVVGEPAWHGIGTVLKEPATALEAIQAAKLDYEVEKRPAFVWADRIGGKTIAMPNEHGVIRTDTMQGFKCVGDRYQIVQNKDAFGFFDSVVGEGQAIYHTAGALGTGEKIWILAKLPNDIIVKGNDIVEKYLILVNTHDGSAPLQMFFSPVRVVCQNTLSAAMSSKTNEVRIRHSGNVMNKVAVARETLQIAIKYYGEFEQIIKGLADRQLTEKEAEKYFNLVIFGSAGFDKEKTKLMNQRDKIMTLWERGIGNDQKDMRNTAWTAYNAVTEYIDHHRKYKGEKEDKTTRLNNIWFGSGADMRNIAFNGIVSMAGLN